MPSLLKKYLLFLGLSSIIILAGCSPTTSSNDNGNTTPTDSAEPIQKIDTLSQLPISKPLAEWPLHPKIEAGKRYPFDQGSKDPDFVAFRKKLYHAVLQKDIAFLKAVIHEDIKFSFGAENGKADFLTTWQLDSKPEISKFWIELEHLLSLGGAFWDDTQNSFYAPYVFMIEDIDDPFMQAVIVGENVRLRDQASSKGKIIGSLNWNLVEFVDQEEFVEETINGETHPWKKIKTSNRETGYVYAKYIRSPIDFRAGFTKYDGKWMMDLFIAGD